MSFYTFMSFSSHFVLYSASVSIVELHRQSYFFLSVNVFVFLLLSLHAFLYLHVFLLLSVRLTLWICIDRVTQTIFLFLAVCSCLSIPSGVCSCLSIPSCHSPPLLPYIICIDSRVTQTIFIFHAVCSCMSLYSSFRLFMLFYTFMSFSSSHFVLYSESESMELHRQSSYFLVSVSVFVLLLLSVYAFLYLHVIHLLPFVLYSESVSIAELHTVFLFLAICSCLWYSSVPFSSSNQLFLLFTSFLFSVHFFLSSLSLCVLSLFHLFCSLLRSSLSHLPQYYILTILPWTLRRWFPVDFLPIRCFCACE